MKDTKPSYEELLIQNENLKKNISEKLFVEQSLNKTIEQYRLLFENVLDGVALIENNKVSYISDSYLNLLGYERNEFENVSLEQIVRFIHPDDVPLVFKTIQEAHLNHIKKIQYCYRVKTKKGEYIWIEDNVGVYYNELGEHLKSVIHARNITERKNAELIHERNKEIEIENEEFKKLNNELQLAKERAETNEQRLQIAAASGQFGIWDLDLRSQIMIWDNRMFELYGITQSTFTNTIDAWLNGIHPEDKERVMDEYAKALRNEKEFNTAFRVVHPSGYVLYIKADGLVVRDSNGTPTRMIGLARDITSATLASEELKKAKERAEEGEHNLLKINNKYKRANQLLEESQAIAKLGGWELDLLTGQLYWTAETYRIHDTSPEEFNPTVDAGVGYFLPESKRIITEALELAMTKGEGYDLLLETYTTKGRKIDVRTTCEVTMLDGKPAKLTGIFQDITDRVNNELQLTKAKEKAEESERLKTAFLQNMSHEIRTPLNAISGFSGMLNKPGLSEEKRNSFISVIQKNSRQLTSIVSDVLTISSLQAKQVELNINEVCINSMFADLLTVFQQQAQNKNVWLYAEKQLTDRLSQIYTDETKITQILTNLLTNALKFTHEGFIELGYNYVQTQGIAFLEFYVKDSGIGISPEFHDKIYERFNQAHQAVNKLYGGTGLGLAISKALVALLEGEIWVESEAGKGSTFYFTIPYKPVNG